MTAVFCICGAWCFWGFVATWHYGGCGFVLILILGFGLPIVNMCGPYCQKISGALPSVDIRIISKFQNMTKPAKTWVFTINNYSDDDIEWVKRQVAYASTLVVSKEKGDNGTPHLQGYVTWLRAYRLAGLKKRHPRAHWEVAKAASDQGAYCDKVDSELVVEHRGRQGRRTDLDDAIEECKTGTARDLWTKHPKTMVRYSKGLLTLRGVLQTQRVRAKHSLGDFNCAELDFDECKCWILWGESGIGKTQFALAHFEKPLFVTHMDDLLKFNEEYDGIIFDDMDFKHLPRSAQIHLLDSDQPRSIHVRYQVASIPAGTRKVFTTNVHNGDIFEFPDAALERRCRRRECAQLWSDGDSETELDE